MHLEMSVKDIDSRASMVLQNYQKFMVSTSNMIYIVALGVGFKCPRKIHLNTQCPPPLRQPCFNKTSVLVFGGAELI